MSETTKPRNRIKLWRWLIILVVIAALAAAGFSFVSGRLTERGAQQEPAAGDIVTAFVGDLSASVNASGKVRAQREARLSLAASGEVAEVFVSEGDAVQAGDPLLSLESDSLERAVAVAQQDLVIQEANLAVMLEPASAEDLAAAEAAVASAQAQLDDLLAGPHPEDVAASEANVRAAEANVQAAEAQLQLANSGASEAEIAAAQADLIAALGQQESTQDIYDQLVTCHTFTLPDGSQQTFCPGLGNPEEITRFNLAAAKASAATAQAKLDALLAGPDANAVAIARAALDGANAQLEAAQANHALLLKGASQAQIAAAEANLSQARANLQALKEGPTEAQIAAAEVAVELARIGLQNAQRNLEEATLYAPFDGVITAVNVSAGEMASGVLVEIVDMDSLEVVLEVDEVDIGPLQVGQTATITLESWPDVAFEGRVASISPVAVSNFSALVAYEVFLGLGETSLPVRVGMTADALLQTASFEDVLLVPSAAINVDRNRGTYSVNRVRRDAEGGLTTERVQINIGLRDGRFTQVIEGLQEGDELLVGNELPVFDFGSQEGPPPGAERGEGGPPGQRP